MNYKKRIVFDVDGTICKHKEGNESYSSLSPIQETVSILKDLKKKDCVIILHTARYMYTYDNDPVKAEQRGKRELIDWCTKWDIPWDEIYMGKPAGDLYIDDKAINIETVKLINKELEWNPRH